MSPEEEAALRAVARSGISGYRAAPTHPDPDPRYVEPDDPLPRFREQRRRSRWGCSVALLAIVAALVVFWVGLGFVAVNVFAAPRNAPIQPAQSGAPPVASSPAQLERPRASTVGSGVGVRVESVPTDHLSGAPLPAAASQPAGPSPVSVPAKTSGVASWYEARGYQGAVPWWRPGQDPVWAAVSRFADGRTYAVTVLVTGWCQCLVGQPGERAIDLSLPAFRELADPSVGLIRVTVEVPVQGPKLPATDQEEP